VTEGLVPFDTWVVVMRAEWWLRAGLTQPQW